MSEELNRVWDLALSAAAELCKSSAPEVAEEIESLKGEEMRLAIARHVDEQIMDDVNRGIFQNVELGLMQDNGDGTFSLTDKGRAHVENMLRRE